MSQDNNIDKRFGYETSVFNEPIQVTYSLLADFALREGNIEARQEYLDMVDIFRM